MQTGLLMKLFSLRRIVIPGLFIFFLSLPLLSMSFCWAQPVIIYENIICDGTYNNSLHDGVLAFQKQTGCSCVEIENVRGHNLMNVIYDCISKKYSPIVLTYSIHFKDILKAIDKHKNTDFIMLDHGDIDRSNVWSFFFAEHEGCFLAGALAALMSKTKKIGFIYASPEYPALLRFRAGYIQGAQAVDPTVRVLERQLGTYQQVWVDVKKAREMAAELIDEGVDVLFAAAGFAGTGALDLAAKKGIYAIGVDSNQNRLHPGTMIGSMIKHSDKAIFIALTLAHANIRRDGIKRLGIAQDALGIEFEGVEPGLVPDEVKKKLDVFKSEILQGKRQIRETLPLPSE